MRGNVRELCGEGRHSPLCHLVGALCDASRLPGGSELLQGRVRNVELGHEVNEQHVEGDPVQVTGVFAQDIARG